MTFPWQRIADLGRNHERKQAISIAPESGMIFTSSPDISPCVVHDMYHVASPWCPLSLQLWFYPGTLVTLLWQIKIHGWDLCTRKTRNSFASVKDHSVYSSPYSVKRVKQVLPSRRKPQRTSRISKILYWHQWNTVCFHVQPDRVYFTTHLDCDKNFSNDFFRNFSRVDWTAEEVDFAIEHAQVYEGEEAFATCLPCCFLPGFISSWWTWDHHPGAQRHMICVMRKDWLATCCVL